MLKHKYLSIFLLSLTFLFSACADTSNLEEALQVAQKEANSLATRNAEFKDEAAKEADALATQNAQEADAASTRAAGALAEAQGIAQEAVSAAEATAEAISAAATAAALPDIDYDRAVYGVIDELDLNGITVTWWHDKSGAEAEAIAQIIEEFNLNNQFGVFVEATNEGALDVVYEKTVRGLSTGDVPSIVLATQGQIAKYQSFGGLVQLDPYFTHPTYGVSQAEIDDIFGAFLTADRLPQYENGLYGFPHDKAMELLFYNQDWLTELGFDGPPRTLKEFVEVACAATDEDEEKIGFTIQPNGTAVAAYSFASGNDIYDYEKNTFAFSNAGTAEYMAAIRTLVEDECATIAVGEFDDQTAFGNGSTLFIQGSSLDLPFISSNVAGNEEPFGWSVAPVPYAGYEPIQTIYGPSLAVTETTPEEQLAAWIFIRFLTSVQQQAKWVRASNAFPIHASTIVGLESYLEENPVYQSAYELLKYGRHEASFSGYDEVRNTAAESYGKILAGDDVSATLANLDSSANLAITR